MSENRVLDEMVGTAGIEPATPTMSTWCSPAELRTHFMITVLPATLDLIKDKSQGIN